MLIAVAPTVSWAATWNVAQTGCNDTSCTPCCTIQAAVEHSVGGDVISVAPGTYPENIDFRNMASVGNISLEAASGPGTVLVSPATGHTLRHGGSHHNLVTIDGIDFSSGAGSACVYLDHAGGAVLRDIDASGCGYTAFLLDNTGNITMRRCTANSNARHGIQIDGASGAYLEDCTTSSNTMDGVLIINVDASVELVNPTAVGNTNHGLDFDLAGPLIINGATATNNGGRGIWAWSTSMIFIQNSDIQGNGEVGIDLEWNGVDPVDLVSLTNTTVSGNGLAAGDSGVRLREISGPVTVTNCVFDNNGFDGLSVESSVVGDLEIVGGHADGNGSDGYDVRVVGHTTVTGVGAVGNNDKGISIDSPGLVLVQDSVASNNLNGSGISIDWQDPATVNGVSVIDCTADGNGLMDGGNGIYIRHVSGDVKVVGTTTIGNARTGVRVDDTAGSVLIRDAVSNTGLEEGIKIDADVGPVTVLDSIADGNAAEGLVVNRQSVDVESIFVRRNLVSNNGGAGVALLGLGGSGPFNVKCNDIAGNSSGIYLDDAVVVDARKVWWGSPTGPSGQGPGSGDGVFAEPGGAVTFSPWLSQSFTSTASTCELFGSRFESGLLEEWDAVAD
ncbi:MAG: right-handed parallel beta-helix repeat-containing protein [Candidatus Sulfomarinibacteraceae bacterium]